MKKNNRANTGQQGKKVEDAANVLKASQKAQEEGADNGGTGNSGEGAGEGESGDKDNNAGEGAGSSGENTNNAGEGNQGGEGENGSAGQGAGENGDTNAGEGNNGGTGNSGEGAGEGESEGDGKGEEGEGEDDEEDQEEEDDDDYSGDVNVPTDEQIEHSAQVMAKNADLLDACRKTVARAEQIVKEREQGTKKTVEELAAANYQRLVDTYGKDFVTARKGNNRGYYSRKAWNQMKNKRGWEEVTPNMPELQEAPEEPTATPDSLDTSDAE
jgi:hypothetical protein